MPKSKDKEGKFVRLRKYDLIDKFRARVMSGDISLIQATRLIAHRENPFMPLLRPRVWQRLSVGGETPQELLDRLESNGKVYDIEGLAGSVDLSAKLPKREVRLARCRIDQLGFSRVATHRKIYDRITEIECACSPWTGAYVLDQCDSKLENLLFVEGPPCSRVVSTYDEFAPMVDYDITQFMLTRSYNGELRTEWAAPRLEKAEATSIVFEISGPYVDAPWDSEEPFSQGPSFGP